MAAITLALSNQKHSPDEGQRRHQGRFVLTISQRGVGYFGETFLKDVSCIKFVFTLKARLNGLNICPTFQNLRWLNTVCARFTDSVSDAFKRALGLW